MSTCQICGVHVDRDLIHRDWHNRLDVDLRMDLMQSIVEAQQKRIQRLEEDAGLDRHWHGPGGSYEGPGDQ